MGADTARQLPAGDPGRATVELLPTPQATNDLGITPQAQLGVASERFLALDVFRGIAIAAMLLVNTPGTARFGYRWLQHAQWNGCQPPDLIFPAFLFIVGVSITYSLAQQQRVGTPRLAVVYKVVRRSLVIFGIGLLLNALPYFDWEVTRIPGVLQRIALCYLVASLVALSSGVKGQAVIAVTLVAVYSALMRWVPVPGYGAGGMEPESNLGAYIDRALMAGHLWHHEWDPEGLFSTIPAVSTTMLGVLAGDWMRSDRSPSQRLAGLLIMGAAGIALGLFMDLWIPINKNLWTGSFVAFTAGAAALILALCYWLVDVKGRRRWSVPFVVFGTNAIAAYALSSLLTKVLALITVTRSDGMSVPLKTFVFEVAFLPLAARREASVLYALAFLLLWLGLMTLLYRKRIFIKI